MNPSDRPAVCLHCEKAPPASPSRLCGQCDSNESIRELYQKGPGWNAEWDAHLQRLAERARRRLPLFPEGRDGELPPRPLLEQRRRRLRILVPVKVHLEKRG
jgi:hypothetical protein